MYWVKLNKFEAYLYAHGSDREEAEKTSLRLRALCEYLGTSKYYRALKIAHR